MNILAITLRADIGGGPEHLFQLTRAYGDQAKVIIACPDEPPYAERYRALDNVPEVIDLPHRAFRLGALWRLRACVKAGKVDVIHSHGKGAGIYSRFLSAVTGIPSIHTFHGLHIGEYGAAKRTIYLMIERALGWVTDAGVCVSQGEAEQITSARILPSRKVHIVPNGVAVPEDLTDRAAPENPLQIIAVSRFDHQKNPMLMVDLAIALKTRIGARFNLTVIGKGDLFDTVAQRVASEGLSDQIRLLGPTTTPRDIMRRGDVFLSTSRWEGMPLAVLEAMSEGLVPVLTDVVGNRDVVRHQDTGMLFPSDDPEAGAQAIIAASETWMTLREAAFKEVAENYSVARMAADTLTLTRRVLDR